MSSPARGLTSWINVFSDTIVDAVKDAYRFIYSSFSFIPTGVLSVESGKIASGNISQQYDVNGTMMLLDVLIRKFTGQKCIFAPMSLREVQGCTLNIMDCFKRSVERATKDSTILMHRLNVDFWKYREVSGKIMGGNFHEIPEILNSYLKRACPSRKVGQLSPKKFDKLITEFNKKIDVIMNKPTHQVGGNILKVNEIKKHKINVEPSRPLNNVFASYNLAEFNITALLK